MVCIRDQDKQCPGIMGTQEYSSMTVIDPHIHTVGNNPTDSHFLKIRGAFNSFQTFCTGI